MNETTAQEQAPQELKLFNVKSIDVQQDWNVDNLVSEHKLNIIELNMVNII